VFSFIADNLSPGERLGEVLFGLIMTLTFTLGAGVLFGEGEGASRDLFIATLGCNIAWGIIDAALYLLALVFERSRLARLRHAIVGTPDEGRALAIVANELDETLATISTGEARTGFYRDVVRRARSGEPGRPRLHWADFKAALVVFWSVVIATLPAAIPFPLIDDSWIALRVSNALLIAVLFIVGYRWAKYTDLNPWLSGFVLMAFGVLLVAIAIPLGG
jgi:hypothetical protein